MYHLKTWFLLSAAILLLLGISAINNEPQSQIAVDSQTQLSIKGDAFLVLELKCNSCHERKNRTKTFTLANMNGFAVKINEQVFIKQRMPKGRKIKLTVDDKLKLRKWLKTVK